MSKKLKDYFIPHEENAYAPHGLQKAAMVGMLFLVVLSFTATNALSLLWISSEWMVSTVLPAVIVDLTNSERGSEALGTLRRSSVLDAAATLKAQDMAQNQYFAHYSPLGVSPWHWFGEVSYNFVHAGENLAIHFTDSGDVVDAWMESPSHRANIMNGNYSEIGVGTAEGMYQGYQTVYVVQLFGTPAAAVAAKPAPLPESKKTIITIGESANDDQEVLAESVSITEDVEIIEAEPEPVEIEEEAEVEIEEQASTSEEVLIAETQATGTEVADMEITKQGVALYSDFISTSTGGVAAQIDQTQTEEINSAPFYLELATQPHKILQVLYILIGSFVLGSLLLSIFVEIRKQQPVQVAYGTGLMALMFGLFYIHILLSTGAFIV